MMEYGNNSIINNSPELSNYIHFMTPLKIHISVAVRKWGGGHLFMAKLFSFLTGIFLYMDDGQFK